MSKPNSESSSNFQRKSSSLPFRNLLQQSKGSTTSKRRSRLRSDAENIAPSNPNIQIPPLSASTDYFKGNLQSKIIRTAPQRAKEINSPLVSADKATEATPVQEELTRAKSTTYDSLEYLRGGNMRESLNQLRLSINHTCIEKDDMEELRRQIDDIHASREYSEQGDSSTMVYSAEGCKTEFTCEHYVSFSSDASECESEEINSIEPEKLPDEPLSGDALSSLSIDGFDQSSVLQDPLPSESPKIKNIQRKSLVLAPNNQTIQKDEAEQPLKNTDVVRQSVLMDQIKSSFIGPTVSLAASLQVQRGLQFIDSQQRKSLTPTRSSAAFSFEHFASLSDKSNASVRTSQEGKSSNQPSAAAYICVKCQEKKLGSSADVEDETDANKDIALAIQDEKELNLNDQAAEIERLNKLLEQCTCRVDQTAEINSMKNQLQSIKENDNEMSSPTSGNKLLTWKNDDNQELDVKDSDHSANEQAFSSEEREELLREIEDLRKKTQIHADAPVRTTDELRSSLLSKSIHLRKSSAALSQADNSGEEFDKERHRWMEMESDWISLTDDLRIEIETNHQRAERVEMELRLEKRATEELDDALKRSVTCQARMVEHFTELQENYNDMAEKHRAIVAWIAGIKRAASKAGANSCHGTRYAKVLSAELSSMRAERERERELLKGENRSLKIQLKDTAEALHAAGEVLVRLKEAEEATSLAEEKNMMVLEENEKLKKQIEKLKRKHKMEMIAMKLPESALGGTTLYCKESHNIHNESITGGMPYDEDQAWRTEFGAIYQEHHY